MAISLKHKFQSSKSDGGDASLVRPSNWNDDHDLTLAASRLLGRAAGTAGAAQEIPLGTGLKFNAGALEADYPGMATGIHAATEKTDLVDDDEFAGTDSANSFGLIKATSKGFLKYLGVNAKLDFFLDCIPSWVSNTSVAFTTGFGFFGGKKHTLPAYTKTMSAFAAGNNNGMLDTGAIGASKTYFLFAIRNTTSGVSDYLASLSLTPAVPSGWELNTGARVGIILTNTSSQIVKMFQSGNKVLYDNPTSLFAGGLASPTQLVTLSSIPVGISVDAMLAVEVVATGPNADGLIWMWDAFQGPTSGGTSSGVRSRARSSLSGEIDSSQGNFSPIRTNTAGQVYRFSAVAGNILYTGFVSGWIDWQCKRLWG